MSTSNLFRVNSGGHTGESDGKINNSNNFFLSQKILKRNSNLTNFSKSFQSIMYREFSSKIKLKHTLNENQLKYNIMSMINIF